MPDFRNRVAPSVDRATAAVGVGVAMLLTFGYEVFNFNLSLDEPVLVQEIKVHSLKTGCRHDAGVFEFVAKTEHAEVSD